MDKFLKDIANLVLIDPEDCYLIKEKRVWLSAGYPAIYFQDPTTGTFRMERLHRIIMHPPNGYGIDHINRNKLDARKCNLRVCTQSQNTLNVGPRSDCKSGVRGVWFDVFRKKWAAQISKGGKRVSLGRFGSLEEAAKKRKEAELVLWGEFAPR